jgi:hypothetical protein
MPDGGVDNLKFGVDIDFLELVDQNDGRIPIDEMSRVETLSLSALSGP